MNNVKKRLNSKTISIIAFAILFIGMAAGLYIWQSKTCDGLALYKPARDKEFLLKLFKDNWYWLIPEDSDFSAEYFLENKSPTYDYADRGISTITVYCHDGKPIGFVSFYPESFYTGRLHFIAIDEKYRGQGFSKKLMSYAMDEMRKKNMKMVTLITRVNNEPAIKLYNSLGFKEFWRDDKFVRFEKEL